GRRAAAPALSRRSGRDPAREGGAVRKEARRPAHRPQRPPRAGRAFRREAARRSQAPARPASAPARQIAPARPCAWPAALAPRAPEGSLMRVVGGRLRGRNLAAPKGQAIRPSSDRLRESLFNILVHAYGDPVGGARVLDLFAGTGALGIEAISRGAAFALFVDDGAEARALIRQNVDT